MTTALSIITDSLTDIGVAGEGQPISAADAQRGLGRLNDMIDAWAIESLYAFATIEYTGTIGTPTTIGPSGHVVTPHIPTQLEGGFVRSGNIDYGFDLINYQEYADISMKSIGGPFPTAGYYDGLGTLQLYPAPSSGELHVSVLARLDEFATLATDYTFNPGVRRAIRLSLNEELAHVYSIQLQPSAVNLAKAARRTLKRSNHVTPQLETYSRDVNSSPGFGSGGTTTTYDGVDGGVP